MLKENPNRVGGARCESMSAYGVVLFHTTSMVMRAEKILLRDGLRIKIVPVPREFSSDCGTAIRFEWSSAARVRALLEDGRVEIAAIHPMP